MQGGELVFYIIVIGSILLFSYISQRSKRLERRLEERAKAHAEQAPDLPGQPEAPEPAPEEVTWGRAPREAGPPDEEELWARTRRQPLEIVPPVRVARAEAPAPTPAIAPAPASTRRRRTQPLLRTPKDLRHAVIAMTVLGPCRALEPYDGR